MELQALLPHLDCGVHAAEAQRNVALLLADAGPSGLLGRTQIAGHAVMRRRLAVGVEGGGGVAGGLEELQRAPVDRGALGRIEPRLRRQGGGAAIVLGQQRHHLVGALARAILDESSDLEVLAGADGLGQHAVGHVADEHVLEGQLGLAGQAAALAGHDDVLLLQGGERL